MKNIVRMKRDEETAAKWAIEIHGAEPHDIEERKNAISYVEEICAVMGYRLEWTKTAQERREANQMRREKMKTDGNAERIKTDELATAAGLTMDRYYLQSRYNGGHVVILVTPNGARLSVTRRSVRAAEMDMQAVIREMYA